MGRRISADERRTALVAAALRVAARRGISHATTRAIVAEAGMSLASFHYVFESRDAFLAEVIRTVVAEELHAVLPDIEPAGTLRDTIASGLERYLVHVRREPGEELTMLELTWHSLRTPELAGLAGSQYESYRVFAREALEAAAGFHGCRWRIPVDDVARLLVSFTDGLTIDWLVHEDEAASALIVGAAADAIAALAEDAS